MPLEELWRAEGRRLSEAVARATDSGAALAVLARGLARPRSPLDPYARQAALLAPGRPFSEISRELGFSERQLRRRVERAVGYGPRMLARVVRLQRFLRTAECGPGVSLARLTGRTPSMLVSAGATAAGERTSGSFKPAASEYATLN